VERIHKIVIPLLANKCQEKSSSWNKHLEVVQQVMISTPPRSTKLSPFRILPVVEMRTNKLFELNTFLEDAAIEELDQERETVRMEAKSNISKIQQENSRSFNKSRKKEVNYKINELVAIKRTEYAEYMTKWNPQSDCKLWEMKRRQGVVMSTTALPKLILLFITLRNIQIC